jgi:hypothetical protein
MNFITINTYHEPRWGSRIAGKVAIRKDSQASYSVDNARVVELRVVDLFTVLTCDDGKTHFVLTAFFQQVNQIQGAHEFSEDPLGVGLNE